MLYLSLGFRIKKVFWYWSKAPLSFFVFFALNYKHWKSQSSVQKQKAGSKFCECVLLKKLFLKMLSLKLPAASECYCSYYGLMFITGKYTISKSRLWSQNWQRQTCKIFGILHLSRLQKHQHGSSNLVILFKST